MNSNNKTKGNTPNTATGNPEIESPVTSNVKNAKALLTEKEVAHMLNVALITVKRWRDRGELVAYYLGARTIRYEPSVIDEFLRNRRLQVI